MIDRISKSTLAKGALAIAAVLMLVVMNLSIAAPTYAQGPTPQENRPDPRKDIRERQFKREQTWFDTQTKTLTGAGTIATKVQNFIDAQNALGKDTSSLVAALATGVVDTMGRAFLPGLLQAYLPASVAGAVGPALTSILIYILMVLVLFFRPQGLDWAIAKITPEEFDQVSINRLLDRDYERLLGVAAGQVEPGQRAGRRQPSDPAADDGDPRSHALSPWWRGRDSCRAGRW